MTHYLWQAKKRIEALTGFNVEIERDADMYFIDLTSYEYGAYTGGEIAIEMVKDCPFIYIAIEELAFSLTTSNRKAITLLNDFIDELYKNGSESAERMLIDALRHDCSYIDCLTDEIQKKNNLQE